MGTSGDWRIGLAVLAAAAACGCSAPEHLTPGFGESYRAALDRQAIREPGTFAQPVTGLDSQEAAIISETYRRSLAPKQRQGEALEEPLIYVAPPDNRMNKANMPPPSVPQDQR
jgi:hypothetical protein